MATGRETSLKKLGTLTPGVVVPASAARAVARRGEPLQPQLLWIGCSEPCDAPHEILGLAEEQLVEHRNLGNVVAHTDVNCLSAIQFAVEALRVERIVVCGHSGCNVLRAAMSGERLGLADYWLRNIKDVCAANKAKLDAIRNEAVRLDMLCELNVLRQVENVCQTEAVRSAWASGRRLVVSGCVYQSNDGLIRELISLVEGSQFE